MNKKPTVIDALDSLTIKPDITPTGYNMTPVWENLKPLLEFGAKQHHLKLDFVIDRIKHLQSIMHVGFMDNVNEMHYGNLTENLHTNIVEISDFINRHEMNAEQSAKSLFDIMLSRDFFNSLR